MDFPPSKWQSKPSKRLSTAQELSELCVSPSSPDLLYSLLLKAGKTVSVSCDIAEGLLHTSRLNPTLFYTKNSRVEVYSGSHAFNKFFEMVDLSLQLDLRRDEKVIIRPQYVIQGKNWVDTAMNKEECMDMWGEAVYVRRFVQGDKEKPGLYRVKWTKNTGKCGVFIVKNCSTPTVRPHSLVQRAVTPTSIYQHDTFTFTYAGKLLKTSFSPYHPYPSLLSPSSTPKSAEKTHRNRLFRGKTSLIHCVDTRNLTNYRVYTVQSRIFPLESTVFRLISAFEAGFKTEIEEIELDFIRVNPEKYILVDVLKVNMQEKHVPRPIVTLRSKFTRVMTPNTLFFPSSPLDFPSSPSLSPLFPSKHRKNAFTSPSPPYSEGKQMETLAERQLEGVEALYDGLMTKVRRAKVDQRDLVAELDAVYGAKHGAELLIDRFFQAFITKNEASLLYENKLRQDFAAMKTGICRVLQGKVTFADRKRIRAVHRKIEDLSALMRVFCRVVRQEARALEISEEYGELIAQRLDMFMREITGSRLLAK